MREPVAAKSSEAQVAPNGMRQHARELQPFGTVVAVPIALDAAVRRASVETLNQLLADTMTVRDLYKKHHWKVSGPTFHDVAETTRIPRPPRGREVVPVQLGRLLHAHEIVLKEARAMARQAAEAGDDGTNDLLVSQIIRTNEQQVWFVGEHLAGDPPVAHEG